MTHSGPKKRITIEVLHVSLLSWSTRKIKGLVVDFFPGRGRGEDLKEITWFPRGIWRGISRRRKSINRGL